MDWTELDRLAVNYKPVSFTDKASALTLELLAGAKAISPSFLVELGIHDLKRGVGIPYLDLDGVQLEVKRRTTLIAKDGSYWPKGRPLLPYGLWKLDVARKAALLFLVEGESDCWALWSMGLPALGIPGANAANVLTNECLECIETIYVNREPGRGGDNFVAGVARKLADLGFDGKLWELTMPEGVKDPSELLIRNHDNFLSALQERIKASKPIGLVQTPVSINGHAKPLPIEKKERDPPVIYKMTDLMAMDLPDPNWAVEGLMGEGLNILAGKPKLGKSWMALNLGLTIAGGGTALGMKKVEPGNVLYLSLEDRLRRVQDRSRKLVRGLDVEIDERLEISVEWPKQHDGGLKYLTDWIVRVERPKLVIIDIWQKFRPLYKAGSQYEQDYEAANEVKSLADKYHCSFLILHHCKKAAAEDVVDEISGTLGLAGAADGLLVLTRARNEFEGKLFVSGRDFEEQELALEFEKGTFAWKCTGDAKSREGSKVRTAILEAFKMFPGSGYFPVQMAELISENHQTVKQTMYRMAKDGLLWNKNSKYFYPPPEQSDTISQESF